MDRSSTQRLVWPAWIRSGRWGILLGALFFLTVLPSCKVGPNYQTPPSQVASTWSVPSTATNLAAADAFWWRQFQDPVLDQLIQRAHQNNLSLQSAGVRILQARAQLNQAIGELFPQQQGISAGITAYRLNESAQSLGNGLSSSFAMDQALFSATWEIDFWGKFRRGIESDRAAFLETVAAYDDALVTLIADVATSYVNIRTFQERLRVAQQNVESQQESLRVATAQFNAGETSELDLRQASALLEQTRAQIPRLQNSLLQTRNGLAVLLGETPDHVQQYLGATGAIPQAPTQVMIGIPHDLLRRRPDVRAAGFTAASQSALIGVARANMLPALSLTGAFGVSGNNAGNNSLSDMFLWQSRAAQGGASLVWPIFNYGRLINQVRVQDAVFQQAVLNYQNTVLTAQQEVENGLSSFITEQQALAHLNAAAQAARRSAELSLIQYKAGESDYTTVLTADQTVLTVEDSVVSSQGSVVLAVISIYRALGGGWELRTGQDVVSDPLKAEMARRTDWGRLLNPQNHLPPASTEP